MAPRQGRIPGTERTVNKKIAAAAEKYVDVRDQRMELTKQEVEAKAALLSVMEEAGLKTYLDEDAATPLRIDIVPGEANVKVRKVQDDDGEERPRRRKRDGDEDEASAADG